MSPQSPIKAVLLDIGNVLLKINWANSLKLIDIPKERVHSFLSIGDTPLFHSYESGAISSAVFHQELCKILQKEIPYEKFDHIWCACFDGEIQGVAELLKKVSQKVPLFTLSNTNESHYDFFKEMPIFDSFEELLTSHKFLCRKPDPLIYKKAIERLGVNGEEILFIDDLEENLKAAREFKIKSEHCFQSASRLESIFRVNNLL